MEKIRPVMKAVTQNFDEGMERRETRIAAVEASLKEKEHEARKLGQKLDSFTMEDLDAGINRLAKRVEAALLQYEKGLPILKDTIEELEAAKKHFDDVVDILEKTKQELKKVVEEIGVLQELIRAKMAEKERALNAPGANK
jgi:chromosome segregation ATPase